MLKRGANLLFGLLFVLISLSFLHGLSTKGFFIIKGSVISGNSALAVVALHLFIGLISIFAFFRNYHAIQRLGYHRLESGSFETQNEAFRRNYDRYMLTFYSWRDFKFVAEGIDYGYRGLYLVMDFKGIIPPDVRRIESLFDKVEFPDRKVIFFKEGKFVDFDDVPNLIRKIHRRIGLRNILGKKQIITHDKQLHHHSTKLDFGKHINRGVLYRSISMSFFILPPLCLAIAINIFVTNEFAKMFGSDSRQLSEFLSGLYTAFIGIWCLISAKSIELKKTKLHKNFKFLDIEEKLKSILGNLLLISSFIIAIHGFVVY